MKPDKPSRTALIVACGLQLAGARTSLPTTVLPADALRFGEQLLRRAHPRLAGLLRKPWFRRLCGVLENVILPGICLHFALRKQILRRHAQSALDAGCTQVIVLGAGFDTLCMELKATRPDVCCIEIDHPATQAAKLAATNGDDIGFIAADLARQDLGSLLAAHPTFHPGAFTLFVAEGLLMYMPLDAVRALFARMAAAAPRSQVAFTWLEPLANGSPGFRRSSRLIDVWLRWRGEPFLSSKARTELATFLAGIGFMLQKLDASGDLLQGAEVTEQPVEGEYVALASAVRRG
jgi:methyltransferase (TIGR00027 family)